MQKDKYLIVIVGPTGSGKTALGVDLAIFFDSFIVSGDSRQVYREMEIGTAKPTSEELNKVKHYFINSHSVYDDFNAGKFEVECLKLLENLYHKKDIIFMVGGSGLYLDAICKGMDQMPETDFSIRKELTKSLQTEGIDKLREYLKNSDPEYYEIVDKQNPQRIIRALEVFQVTGKPYSSFRKKKGVERPFKIIKIGLQIDRPSLYERIDNRIDKMIDAGLFEEAETLYPLRHLNALQTVGYSEIFDYLDKKYEKEEAIRLLKRNSRRYAKRQFTWFSRDKDIIWFKAEESLKIKQYILEKTQE